MSVFDDYDDFLDEEEEMNDELYKKLKKQSYEATKKARQRNPMYEVGLVPPLNEELLALRAKYESDYVSMHQEVFTRSTGIKPFGEVQIKSINHTLHVLNHGGRCIIIEPRGFGKTSRTANNALAAILQGKIKYALILASSVTKANEILESIKTELVDNEELAKLYPAICACFAHLSDNPMKGKRQTYKGELTHIGFSADKIRMPTIPGEPSSGAIIQVRPKDNVRGLHVKVRYGPNAGKVLRPDFAFLDDIQTDKEAESPMVVRKIVQTIKKSVLFAGSHAKRISAVMCATPIQPGDVVHHLVLNESSWSCVLNKMLVKEPKNLDLWMGPYARLMTNYDRELLGDRTRAQLEAKQFVIDNYDELHEGAEAAWEWAYGWEEDPQTEVSAVQHAMNIRIEEGEEAFNSECQCIITDPKEGVEELVASVDTIINKQHNHKRRHCPVETKYVTTHIDINKRILSYVTASSPEVFRPMVIDYGTWPDQHGAVWYKAQPSFSIQQAYRDATELSDQLYIALRDLLDELSETVYYREDGIEMYNNLITVDQRYEIDAVHRAIRDSKARNITCCAAGKSIKAKDKPLANTHYGEQCTKHYRCVTVPTRDRISTVVYMDVNFIKVMVHRAFKTRLGLPGSLSLFKVDRTAEHILYADHCRTETPEEDYYEKENRTVTIWSEAKGDNEWFDNTVGCFANLFKLGVSIKKKKKAGGVFNMQDFIDGQKS